MMCIFLSLLTLYVYLLQIVRKNFNQGNILNNHNNDEDGRFVQVNPQLCVSVELSVTLLEKMRRTDSFMSAVMETCQLYI